MNMKL